MKADSNLTDSLYRRFRRRPESLEERGLYLLADNIIEQDGMTLDGDRLVFSEMDAASPLRSIVLDNIHGVADLGGLLAIVMHSSIIFFNKSTHETSVHLKPSRLPLRR